MSQFRKGDYVQAFGERETTGRITRVFKNGKATVKLITSTQPHEVGRGFNISQRDLKLIRRPVVRNLPAWF